MYLKILFGLQLGDYILFALLVFVAHAVVNQKHVGYLVALIAYGVIVLPSIVGLEHHLLIYGSGPRWTYSDIRGFGPSLAPWLWFKLYWAAWALLLAVAATLLWPRPRTQFVVAASGGAPSFHACDGDRRRDGSCAYRRPGRFHLLQHQLA
jgi:ABC-2 type transport system permease protein